MATRKTAVTTAVDIEEKTDECTLEQENETLKKQMDEMRQMIATLQEQYNKQNSEQKETAVKKTAEQRTITFVNLTSGTFVLRGSQIYTLDKQFDARTFSEREATVIVNTMSRSIRSGRLYIDNADFVRENGFEDICGYILTPEILKNLMVQRPEYIIDVYKNCSDEQKEIITDMIIRRRLNGEPVDGNVLIELGKLSGKNLTNIEKEED